MSVRGPTDDGSSAGALEVSGLAVRRGGRRVLEAVDLRAPAGRVTALVGANGAGKSTLLRAVLGFERPETGHVRLDGMALDGLPVEARIRRGLGWCPEGRRLFPAMTVEETLMVAAPGPGGRRETAVARMFERFPGLADKRGEHAWRLSGGQQQMLALARAMIAEPRALLLDEPSLGLAPALVEGLAREVRAIAAGGTAVLLSESHVSWALGSADAAVVLSHGCVVASGPAWTVAGSPALERALIG